jgi:hypothetical protein
MNESSITVASCTIDELFSEKINEDIQGILEIPEYQRSYVWSKKEIKELLSDIEKHNNKQDINKPMYYLGSIILHKHDDKLSIIDGQQRITTLAIIQHINDKNKVPKIKYLSPSTIENIKKNHEYLEKKKSMLREINFSNLNVTLIVTKKEDDAYTFFETQNTGGVRLSGIDIIKAHHLREISQKGKPDEKYARTWEKQKEIGTVIKLLIKARRWAFLCWEDVPSDRDEIRTKESIIKDFSKNTLEKSKKSAYPYIISTDDNYFTIKISPYKLAIRQPLANGENFIDYLEQYAELYARLFISLPDAEICNEYYNFNKKVIKIVDGTAFLKEFYEIAILCYVNKFGIDHLLEASYWIFRYAYSLRLSNRQTVRENSIPAFIIRKKHYLFDIILASFNHEQLIEELKQYKYEINEENTEGNTVKSRFIERVMKYFCPSLKTPKITEFDEKLKKGIETKLKGIESGKKI